MIDISNGGLSFYYTGHKDWVGDSVSMDFIDRPLFLIGIPVKIVSDKPYEKPSKGFNSLWLRRCGVQFTELTDKQQNDIKRYIDSVSS